MNQVKNLFSIFDPRGSAYDVTHEGITSCPLTRLMRQMRDLVSMWDHVDLSYASAHGATQSCRLL
jgi:hypothetical protein